MREKEIRVTDILLDTGNYRTGKHDDQRKAIKALIEEQKGKLVVLARDIIENGLSPLETVMVYAVPGEKNRYVVIEGNRRIAAMKLALLPDLAAETTWHKAFQKVHKLAPGQIPKKITCKIADFARLNEIAKLPSADAYIAGRMLGLQNAWCNFVFHLVAFHTVF
jgi:hypothetical protein